MEKKFTKKKKLFVKLAIFAACAIALAVWVALWSPEDEIGKNDTSGTYAQTPAGYEPRIIFAAPDTVAFGGDFYDLVQIQRDGEYNVFRVLSQTHDGTIIANVLPNSWPSFEQPQLPNHIARLSMDFQIMEPFFQSEVPWRLFHFSVADKNGYVFVLAEHSDASIAMYVYNINGNEVNRYDWRHELSLGPGVERVFITNNTIVRVGGGLIAMFSIEGDVLFGERNTFLIGSPGEHIKYGSTALENIASATVGGEHLYIKEACPEFGYRLHKIIIPDGETIWNEPLPRQIDAASMAFDEVNGLLYFNGSQESFIFDENTWSIRQIMDWRDTEFYRFLFLHNFFAIQSSFTITHEGLLHLVTARYCCATHLYEWVLVRLEGEEAGIRQEEIRIGLAERDFISKADVSHHSTHDYLRELAREYDILFRVNTLGGGGTTGYVERLNAALLAGNANWDIIFLPLQFVDLSQMVELGLLVNVLDVLGADRFSDETRYFTNLFELSKVDGGLYFLPFMTSVPVLWVSNDTPGLDKIQAQAQNWTWGDFLDIVQELYTQTGTPPITAPDAFRNWNIQISNVLPFYMYDEVVLRNIPGNRQAFSRALQIYNSLVNPGYNMTNGQMSFFTFSEWGMNGYSFFMQFEGINIDFSQTHTLLPIPSMNGERPFVMNSAYAFLATGQHIESAIDVFVEYLDLVGLEDEVRSPAFRAPVSPVRPSQEVILAAMNNNGFMYEPATLFETDAAIRSQANTRLSLPQSVTEAIHEVVESYVHGVLSLAHTVERIEDIMWLFLNE